MKRARLPYLKLRLAAATFLTLSFIVFLVGNYSKGPFSGSGPWLLNAAILAAVVVAIVTTSAYRRR